MAQGDMIMAVTKLAPRNGDILLMVGTVKGAFIFLSDAARGNFRMSEPHFPGQSSLVGRFHR
jgi:hypothetical protein